MSALSPTVILTRELRFGLWPNPAPSPANSANGFAANPPLMDMDPFLTLRASVSGPIDPATGMLINIKIIDRLLREHAVGFLGAAHKAGKPAAAVLPELFAMLAGQFSGGPHMLARLALAPSPYLRFTIDRKEPHVVSTTQRFEFSAAHRLHSAALSENQNWEVFGRCTNPNGHGHNYELEVTLAGEPDAATGQVFPGGIVALQRVVNERVLDVFDHKHLNLDCPEFKELNPTVENIARIIYQKLKEAITGPARLVNVRVWETPKTVCEYSEEGENSIGE